MVIARTHMLRRTLTPALTTAGIAVLVLAPTAARADAGGTAEAAPGTPGTTPATVGAATLGPDGYKELELGMSEDAAVATGLLTDRQEIGNCAWYYLDPDEGAQNPGAGVVVSPTRGVVNIPGTENSQTPEGITMGSVDDEEGSTTEQIEAGYDRYTVDKTGPTPLYTAPAPGNSQAHYIFAIGEDGRAKDMGLTADDDGGECGLND